MVEPGMGTFNDLQLCTLGRKLAGEDLIVLPPGGQVWKRGEDGS